MKVELIVFIDWLKTKFEFLTALPQWQSHYQWLIVAIVVCLACLLIYFWRYRDPYPYHRRNTLLTKPESQFYKVLVEAVSGDALIFAKPRIADVLAVNSMKDKKHWQRSFNRIAQKHVDFVLCDKDSQAFICAIELNDRSHERPDRKRRDVFVVNAFKRAKLPLIMQLTQNDYSSTELRHKLLHLL